MNKILAFFLSPSTDAAENIELRKEVLALSAANDALRSASVVLADRVKADQEQHKRVIHVYFNMLNAHFKQLEEVRAERDAALVKLRTAEVDGLNHLGQHAIEELFLLGYTVKDGLLYPPVRAQRQPDILGFIADLNLNYVQLSPFSGNPAEVRA